MTRILGKEEIDHLKQVREGLRNDSTYRSWEDEIGCCREAYGLSTRGGQYSKLLFAEVYPQLVAGKNSGDPLELRLGNVLAGIMNYVSTIQSLIPEFSLKGTNNWEIQREVDIHYETLRDRERKEYKKYKEDQSWMSEALAAEFKREEEKKKFVYKLIDEMNEEVDRELEQEKSEELEMLWDDVFASEDCEGESHDTYPAQMGECAQQFANVEPFRSENHVSTLSRGEILVGGMPQKKKKRAKKHKKGGPRKRVVLYNPLPSMPDEFDTKIRTFGAILPAGATASVISQVFTNSLLHSTDDFSTGGSNSTLSNIGRSYAKYRVTGYSIKYTLVSRSTTESNFAEMHSPDTLGYSAAVSWQPESATRDKAYYFVVPANTKSPCVVGATREYSMMSIVGQEEFKQDDKYYGAISAVGVPSEPTDKTYLTFYTGPITGSFTASTSPGIYLLLEQTVKFYDKRI